MTQETKTVDGFRFLPPKLSAWIRTFIPESYAGTIPFHRLSKPLEDARLTVVTTAGISLKTDEPFDMEREKKEPTRGDPTYREIPKGTTGKDIDVNHLHVNTDYVKQDINVVLPINRFQEFAADGTIGGLATTAYSYYGYQMDPSALLTETMPKVAADMKAEGVEAVLLTPT